MIPDGDSSDPQYWRENSDFGNADDPLIIKRDRDMIRDIFKTKTVKNAISGPQEVLELGCGTGGSSTTLYESLHGLSGVFVRTYHLNDLVETKVLGARKKILDLEMKIRLQTE